MNTHQTVAAALIMAAAGSSLLAGCYSSSAVRETPGIAIRLLSSGEPDAVAECIQESWSGSIAATNTPFQGGRNVRVVVEDIVVIAQADVLPDAGGSVINFTTPYAAQVHYYEPAMKACAEKEYSQ